MFETIQAHCLAKPGAFEDYPWGDTVWKVRPKGKIFCFGGSSGTAMTVRATLDEQAALTQLPGIKPAPYLARHGWVFVDLTEPQNAAMALDLIDRSYELVTAGKGAKIGHGRNAEKSEQEWRGILTPEQYHVLREKGTERAFTGKYWDHHEEGTYRCAGCGAPLFESTAKFDSGCGWPSFYQALDPEKVQEHTDTSHGMRRVEVTCRACGGHLGHVFPDAPKTPTGLRYCINSASIKFDKE